MSKDRPGIKWNGTLVKARTQGPLTKEELSILADKAPKAIYDEIVTNLGIEETPTTE